MSAITPSWPGHVRLPRFVPLSYLEEAAGTIAQMVYPTTAEATGIITLALEKAAEATPGARKYRELRLPVVPQRAVRYGRLDLVIWHPDFPDIVIEIDSAPNPDSARKLEFARDAGALPFWVRHGKGGITEPEGVSVLDMRESVGAMVPATQDRQVARRLAELRARREARLARANEEGARPAGQADTAPARLEASRETAEWLDAQIKALGELPFRVTLGIDDGRWNWRCDRPGCQGGHYVGSPELQAAIGPCTAGRPSCPCCR